MEEADGEGDNIPTLTEKCKESTLCIGMSMKISTEHLIFTGRYSQKDRSIINFSISNFGSEVSENRRDYVIAECVTELRDKVGFSDVPETYCFYGIFSQETLKIIYFAKIIADD